jgi:hypothetical protein
MNKPENKEFYDLISKIANDQSFETVLTDGNAYTFKQLTTNQLKELVKTVVDSPLTQSLFNSTISKIMKESCLTEDVDIVKLNVIDRLIYILETRIRSLSDNISLTSEDTTYVVDLKEILKKLRSSVAESKAIFAGKAITGENVVINCEIPLIETENQLNEELYKTINVDVENVDELRKLLGETFINELTKVVKSITIGEQTLDMSSMTFKSRIKMIEGLPASLIKNVITFVENYKQIAESSLEITKNLTLPIDGSLFSLR